MSDSNQDEIQTQLDELKATNEALVKKNRELLGEVKTAKAKAKGADIDPEDYAALQTQVDDLKDQLEKSTKAHAKEMDKLTATLAKKDGSLQSYLIDNGLNDALLAANVKPELMPAVKAMLKAQTTLKEDGEGYAALMGDKPLAEGVLAWAGTDAGKPFIAASDNSGGGAAGGNANGAGQPAKGDLGGTKTDRLAAINARFPELNTN